MRRNSTPDNYRTAILKDRNGDLSKRWYVEFYALNTDTNRLERADPIYCPARYKTAASRYKWGKQLCHEINSLLAQGYTFGTPIPEPVPEPDPVIPEPVVPEPAVTPVTFLKAFEFLVKLRERTHRDRTAEAHRHALAKWKEYSTLTGLDELPLESLSLQHGNDFSDWLINVRGLANRTRNNLIADTKTNLNTFVIRKQLSVNPWSDVAMLPQEDSRIHDVYTEEQREKLTQHLLESDRRLYYFTQIIYQCFIRPAELMRLRVSDINQAQNTIKIHSSSAKGGRKSHKYETVAITGKLRPILEEMNLHLYRPSDFVFGKYLNTGPESTYRNRVSERHTAVLREIELYNGELTLYSWKHTGVSNAYLAGADILWLQKQLRHSSLEDTQIYLRSLGLMPIQPPAVDW